MGQTQRCKQSSSDPGHLDLKTFSNVMQVVSIEIMTTLYHLMKSQHTPPAIGEIEHSC